MFSRWIEIDEGEYGDCTDTHNKIYNNNLWNASILLMGFAGGTIWANVWAQVI